MANARSSESGLRLFQRRLCVGATRRDALSSDQLALVESIRVISVAGECWAGAIELRMKLDAPDSAGTYDMNEYNGNPGATSHAAGAD